MESTFARTDSLSLVLLRKRIIRPSGTFLDLDDHPKLTILRCCRTVPLALLSVEDGKPRIDNTLILNTREKFISLDTAKPYKINSNTTGVCMFSVADQLHILSHFLGQIVCSIPLILWPRFLLRPPNQTLPLA